MEIQTPGGILLVIELVILQPESLAAFCRLGTGYELGLPVCHFTFVPFLLALHLRLVMLLISDRSTE
jgi:hypothetical protein